MPNHLPEAGGAERNRIPASRCREKPAWPCGDRADEFQCRPGTPSGNQHSNERSASRMKDFAGKIAVVTGGGTGMGRELARQLVAEGCNVAICDISADALAEPRRLCGAEEPGQGLRITTHIADVSLENDLLRFRDEIAEQHATDRIHLLFNNAGIGGGGSLFTNSREQWERT